MLSIFSFFPYFVIFRTQKTLKKIVFHRNCVKKLLFWPVTNLSLAIALFCNYREADDYEKVPEGGDHNADGHEDGDEDRQHHAERGGPAGGAAVLNIHTSDSASAQRYRVKYALVSDPGLD